MVNFEHMRMHPERPKIRQIRHAAARMRERSFAVVPTETTYAIMMLCDAFSAQKAVRELRGLDDHHLWSLVCHDVSQAAKFVKIDNQNHRILKRYLPGPFTFVLPANSTIHRRVLNKRKDIGIRIPNHAVCNMLLQELGQPLLATSMQFIDQNIAAIDPDEIAKHIKHKDAILLDTGWGGAEPTTVVDLTRPEHVILRQGQGKWALV
ncbi:MAG: L-threonylcarbamoyladenylate synthase [Mariprofundaceae bacterium]|nr:L-threonylcarbamoyladenylate synthase [Mariprofundaceae bacterium]